MDLRSVGLRSRTVQYSDCPCLRDLGLTPSLLRAGGCVLTPVSGLGTGLSPFASSESLISFLIFLRQIS